MILPMEEINQVNSDTDDSEDDGAGSCEDSNALAHHVLHFFPQRENDDGHVENRSREAGNLGDTGHGGHPEQIAEKSSNRSSVIFLAAGQVHIKMQLAPVSRRFRSNPTGDKYQDVRHS